jgi:cyclic lactone autoinducer peptide
MKITKIIANGVLSLAEKAAEISCSSASVIGFHQPEEPENFAEELAKIKEEK